MLARTTHQRPPARGDEITATHFILASHGWSGSNWAANALNEHPAITCTHSARNLLPQSQEITDHADLARHARAWNTAYAGRTNRPIDAVYDAIEQLDETPVYGSVHTFRLRDIPLQLANFGVPRRTYRVANLVRHPLGFIWSGYGQLRDMFAYDLYVLHGTISLIQDTAKDYVTALARRHALNLCDHPVLAFIGAAANLTNLAKDIGVLPRAHWFKMEELTTQRQIWSDCVTRLSAGRAAIDADYLDRVFDLDVLNSHRSGAALDPPARWGGLTAWQRDIVSHYLSLSGIVPAYAALGYDFEFISARGPCSSNATPSISDVTAATTDSMTGSLSVR
jgi:hypothetical protein